MGAQLCGLVELEASLLGLGTGPPQEGQRAAMPSENAQSVRRFSDIQMVGTSLSTDRAVPHVQLIGGFESQLAVSLEA